MPHHPATTISSSSNREEGGGREEGGRREEREEREERKERRAILHTRSFLSKEVGSPFISPFTSYFHLCPPHLYVSMFCIFID